MLENERVAIDGDDGSGIDLVGIPDTEAQRFAGQVKADLGAALAGRDRSRPAILLAHHPRVFEQAATAGPENAAPAPLTRRNGSVLSVDEENDAGSKK